MVIRSVAVSLALLAAPWLQAVELVTIRGSVRDQSGHALIGAQVVAEPGGGATAATNSQGEYSIELASDTRALRATQPGFEPSRLQLAPPGTTTLDFTLSASYRMSESVVVSAIRADARAPVTKRDLDREELQTLNYSQEMPLLLTQTPSITSYSESGSGAGYSYFTLRGISQSRVNMTLDGAPLSDPEETVLYFTNFTDFTSSLDSIQIQRGVGTSTVGAPSYGGSINFVSVDPREQRQAQVELEAGSFATHRGSATLHSGDLGNGIALYGRATINETDGFRDHSGVDQHAVYIGAMQRGSHHLLKLFAFFGHEASHLAYLASDADALATNLRDNPLTPAETDNFGQDFAQLQYTRSLGSRSSLSASGYYNGARGWFLIWDDPVAQTALQKFSIDGYFVGSMVAFNHTGDHSSLQAGVHYNHFTRDHFLDVADERQYTNNGRKSEANAFVKATRDLNRLHLFGDAQIRHSEFAYRGDIDLGSVDWTFFNPKLGARYDLGHGHTVYASLGKATREPTRTDLLTGEDNATVPHDLRAVKPERVIDFELGIDHRQPGLAVALDVYAMAFHDEIAATGELSEIGLPLRKNVDRSYRRGIELDVDYDPVPWLRLHHSSSLNISRIASWTQFYDVYDSAGSYLESVPLQHADVAPLLTPPVIVSQRVELRRSATRVALSGRYVAKSHLDNTGNADFETPSFFDVGLSASIGMERWRKAGKPRLSVQVNNLLNNHREFAGGYSYLFFNRDERGQDALAGTSYYYPLATRSVFVTLRFEL